MSGDSITLRARHIAQSLLEDVVQVFESAPPGMLTLVFQQSGPQIQAIFLIAVITQFLLLPAGWLADLESRWGPHAPIVAAARALSPR